MSESMNEPLVIQLHKKLVEILEKTSINNPVSLMELRKTARAVSGGDKVLEQFLEQLADAKAIASSSGMRDGEPCTNYWVTANFRAFTKGITAMSIARPFTAGEKELIRKVHNLMPAAQLLDVLNSRLVCDLGPDAVPYTMDQLNAQLAEVKAPGEELDWPSMRKLIAQAARDGILEKIDEQVINDFAVVFSLNAKQVLLLKDIILEAKED